MAPMPDNSKENSHQELFLCGVVEGFYGRPWTTEQRKDLFTKLQVNQKCIHTVMVGYEIFLSIAGYGLEFIHQNKKILDTAEFMF